MPGPFGCGSSPTPGATRWWGEYGAAVKIKIAASAVEGKANEAVLAFLAERLGVGVRAVDLLAGEKAATKWWLWRGLTAGNCVGVCWNPFPSRDPPPWACGTRCNSRRPASEARRGLRNPPFSCLNPSGGQGRAKGSPTLSLSVWEKRARLLRPKPPRRHSSVSHRARRQRTVNGWALGPSAKHKFNYGNWSAGQSEGASVKDSIRFPVGSAVGPVG